MPVIKKKPQKNPNLVIFTDLDGTLLDSNYSFKEAVPALKLIKEKNIPLILCSSKTRAEIEYCRKKLKNNHPFIFENGGGVIIPKKYFKFQISNYKFQIDEEEKYLVINLGASYSELRNALNELRSEGFDIVGFGDMSVKKVAELTGLKIADAKMAKQRNFDEPFIIPACSSLLKGGMGEFSCSSSVRRVKRRIKAKGFNFTQGEFFHIMGNSDKGRAVKILKKLYYRQNREIFTVALGDSPNDIEMLRNVDYPIIVQKHDGSYDRRIRIKKLIEANDIGPKGWNRAVIKLLETLLV